MVTMLNPLDPRSHIPVWDPARPRRPSFVEWLPFQKLDQRYKVEAALKAGAHSFAAIAFVNGFSALVTIMDPLTESTILFGTDKWAIARGNLIVAAIAVLTWRIALRHPSLPIFALATAWALTNFLNPITVALYGHGSPLILSAMTLAAALSGLCGALALSRPQENADLHM